MATWHQFETEAPDLAAAVRARLAATKHHVLATLRRDGSPRVSGTEITFFGDDLALGSMIDARKAKDMQRDGRFALHSNPGDGSMDGGDAKLAGVAREVTDPSVMARFFEDEQPPGPFHLFVLDVQVVALTSLHPDGDRIVIETWHPGQEIKRVERA